MSLVKKEASCSPGIGGTVGLAPVAITIWRVLKVCSEPSGRRITTVQGEVMRACPCSTSTPSAV